jgi:hypothetical protein
VIEQLILTHLRADKIDPPPCGVGSPGFGSPQLRN